MCSRSQCGRIHLSSLCVRAYSIRTIRTRCGSSYVAPANWSKTRGAKLDRLEVSCEGITYKLFPSQMAPQIYLVASWCVRSLRIASRKGLWTFGACVRGRLATLGSISSCGLPESSCWSVVESNRWRSLGT
eukprot:3917715-Amphidinium_carterae.6